MRQGAEEVPIGSGQRRALLALLLRRPSEAIAADILIDGLWGDDPPATARTALQVHVSQLRKALGDHDGELIQTVANGYLIAIPDDSLDLRRFRRLLSEGRRALEGGDPARAHDLLAGAVTLWRGSPFEGVDLDGIGAGDAATLEEERDEARALRIEADLALGRHREVVPELEQLAVTHPFDERYAQLLALALYRAGRPADALAAIARLRRSLADDLGLDAGPAIERLERAILNADPSLTLGGVDEEHPPRETRKVVTAVRFRLEHGGDPEARRGRVLAVSGLFREIVTRLDGTVDDGPPDRLTGVFGLPTVHEDDAIRGLRAAWELRERAPSAAADLRVGVATGEVIAETEGDRRRLLTTDPLDAAETLALSADPGDILLAQSTYRLARAVAGAEPHESVRLGDGRVASTAFRLRELAPEPTVQRPRAPIVGRDGELAAITAAFDMARADRRPRFVAVMGAAGIGKTRLADAAASALGARVAVGRCLPYGRDITFWPIAEVIRDVAGVTEDDPLQTVHDKIASLVAGAEDDVAFLTAQLDAILGLSDEPPAPDELFWAVRRFVELAGADEPLVVVIEDLHWADEKVLDLLEYLRDVVKDASLLLLGLARPEVRERRASFGRRDGDVVLELPPLPEEASAELVRHALGGAELEDDARRRLMMAADGNPLFLEELLSMLIDDGWLHHDGERWRVRAELGGVPLPPSVRALLEARLDRLPPDERDVLEAAAIVGRSFADRDLAELRPDVAPTIRMERLDALVARDLITVDRFAGAGDRSYSFHHILMRDAVYSAVPKERRAQDHERFGDALERRSGDRLGELEEIVGYHFETAWRLRTELGHPADDLGMRASRHLANAGHRALARDDPGAAASLFARARACLTGDNAATADLALHEAVASFRLGEFTAAERTLAAGIETAERRDDVAIRWRLLLERQELGSYHRPDEHGAEATRTVALDAIEALEALGDTAGVARAYRLLGDALVRAGRLDEALEAYATGRGLTDDRDALARLEHPLMGALHGPMPLDRYIAEAEAYLARTPRSSPESLVRLGLAYAMAGRHGDAEEMLAQALERARDVGGSFRVADAEVHEGFAHLFLGDPERAQHALADAVALLASIDERNVRSTALALLAEALFRTGDFDAAVDAAAESERLTAADDPASQIAWRGVTAKIWAARGRLPKATKLAREAVAIADRTEFLAIAAQAHLDLAEVLDAAGATAEAARERDAAEALFRRKGVVAG
ncbi:MAG TPA: BTAD domain-containing putative transcriptional regulator [Actinomycetota bacterium]|nr:BTAD domain-containing putative transcriptional regulator [Actinomycetota bacterium]